MRALFHTVRVGVGTALRRRPPPRCRKVTETIVRPLRCADGGGAPSLPCIKFSVFQARILRCTLSLLLILIITGCAGRRAAPASALPFRFQQAQRAQDQAMKLLRAQNWSAAAPAWQAVADQFRLLNEEPNEALALHNLARAERELGHRERAARLLEEAAAINDRASRRPAWWRNQIALAQQIGRAHV